MVPTPPPPSRGGGGGSGGANAPKKDKDAVAELEKDVLFVQMALDDARSKGKGDYVVPALIKLGLLHFNLVSALDTSIKDKEGKEPGQGGEAVKKLKARREEVLGESEKHLQEAMLEGKKLATSSGSFDVEQMVLILERLSALAEKRGNFAEMEKRLRRLLGENSKSKNASERDDVSRRGNSALCFALLKQNKWKELQALALKQVHSWKKGDKGDESGGSGRLDGTKEGKEVIRLCRYLSDCVNHLEVTDETDKQLRELKEWATTGKLKHVKSVLPVVLRALCTSLKRRKKYKELCTVAAEYAEELKKSLETQPGGKTGGSGGSASARQCADMHRLSSIAYNALGKHEEAKKQAELGRQVLGGQEGSGGGGKDGKDAQQHSQALYLCCKEEIKALNQLKDYEGMISVMRVAEEHIPKAKDAKGAKEQCSFYTNFGFAFQSLGKEEEALGWYEKAVVLAKDSGIFDASYFNTVLTCGNLALSVGKVGWGVVFLGRFLQVILQEDEDTACKALVVRAELLVREKKYQDALDSLGQAWGLCTKTKDDKGDGRKQKMALITSNEMANIYKKLDNLVQYCQWKEREIEICERASTPKDLVDTKIDFINTLIVSESTHFKDKLQKHFRDASELVKKHDLKECGENLSKLYVNLLASDDLVDTDFSAKILDAGLSAVSKFKVTLSEIKTHIGKGRLKEAGNGMEKLKSMTSGPHDEVEFLLVQATLATKKGELQSAGSALDNAIKKASGDDQETLKLRATALRQSGGNLNIRGQYDRSLKRLQESMAIYIELGDKEGELGALSAIGYVYLDLKEDGRAESAFKQTLDFASNGGSKEQLSNALLDLGNLYINTRNIEGAEEHVMRALKISQELDSEYNIARAYAALCNIEFSKKNYKKAFGYANQAKELLARSEDAVFTARLLANLGQIYEKLGAGKSGGPGSTIDFHKKNLEVAKESGDNVLYCTSLLTLGETVNTNIAALLEKETNDESGNHIYVTKKIIDEALGYYNECLEVAKRNHDLTSEGNALRGIATTKRFEHSSRIYLRRTVGKTAGGRNFMRFFTARKDIEAIRQKEMNVASTEYLLWAARTGDLFRIKELLQLGHVDPDISDEEQFTALHHAAQEGHLPVVKYLIEDAKANAQCETIHFDTPYALALSRGRKEVSDYLKDIAGVLPFVKAKVMREVEERRISGIKGDYKQFSEYHRLAWNGQVSQDLSDHDEFDVFKRTTLMMAAYRGQVEWVKAKLLQDPSSVLKKDTEDWNALHWCCASECDADAQIEIAELLLGVNRSILTTRDSKGLKAHQLAVHKGNRKVANLLQVRYQAKEDFILLPALRSLVFLFVMALYGFFFPLFVMVGYLRRRRIARILGKIPQTCFQILTPSKNLVFQKAKRVGLNERTIFFLVLPFFLFMWVYPSILILGIIPSLSGEIQDKLLYLVGIYYILVAVFLFLSTMKCFKEKELLHVRHPRERIRLKIYPNDFKTSGTRAVINVVRIVICVFDFLAFANFGIPKNLLDITRSQSSDEYHVLEGWKGFGSQIILDFRRNTFVYSFWLGLLAVTIWFLLSTYLGSAMVILHNKKLGKMFPFVQPDFFSNIPGLSSIVPILAVAAVLPISSIFFRALDCAYVSPGTISDMNSGVLFFQQRGVNMTLLQLPEDTRGTSFDLVDHCRQLGINETALLPMEWQSCSELSYSTPCSSEFLSGLPDQRYGCCPVTKCPIGYSSCLESQRDIKCWDGGHVFYSLVGLTYLMYYIPSCVVIGIYFMEPDEDVNDIRFTGAYMMLEIAMKWIISLLYTFFDGLPIITQVGCIAVTGSLAYANYVIQPCRKIWSMNHYRSSAFALNCWIAVTALVGVIMKQEGSKPASVVGIEVSVWIIMLVLGGGLIVLITLMIHAAKLKVPLSKLLTSIRDNSKKAERRERMETEIRKSKSIKSSTSMMLNPLSSNGEGANGKPGQQQRLHALTMDIEMSQMHAKTISRSGSIIKTENPLSSISLDEGLPLSTSSTAEGLDFEQESNKKVSNPLSEQEAGSTSVDKKQTEVENPLAKKDA